jgi:hypothetical protein
VLVTLRVLDYRLDPRHVQQAPMRATKQNSAMHYRSWY